MGRYLDIGGTRYLLEQLHDIMEKMLVGDVDLSNYVTKTELQKILDELNIDIDLSNYVTKEELEDALADIDTSNIDLSAYATKEYVTDAINNAELGGDGSSVDLSIYAKKTDLDAKADKGHKHTMSDIADYEEPDLSVYATREEIPSLDGYATEEYVDNAISNIDIPTGGNVDLSNYYNKVIYPTITGLVNEVDLYEKAKEQGGVIKHYHPATPGSMYEIIKSSGTSPNVRFSLNTTEWNIEKYVGEIINGLGTPHDFSVDKIVLASTVSRKDLLNKVDATVLLADNNGIWMYEITDGKFGNVRKFASKNNSSQVVTPCYKITDIYDNDLCPDFTNTFFHYDCGMTVIHPVPDDFDLLDYVTPVHFKYIPLGYFRKNSDGTYTYSSDNTFNYIGSTYILNSEGIVKSILDDYFVVKSVEEYTEYYTRDEWALLLDNATKNEANVDLSNYYTKPEVDALIPTVSDGEDGTDGEDGFSPIATVTKADGVATISITDANGTTTVTVSDGVNGQDGKDGTNGTNGINGTDGITPHIDETTKHWFIGETDTGVLAEGVNGVDGKDGTNGVDGTNGQDGADGYTPVRGTDYWTEQDIQTIKDYIDTELGVIENGSY